MRRKDREITDFEQIAGVIEKGEVCRIAMNDEYPYIVPLNMDINLKMEQSFSIFTVPVKDEKLSCSGKIQRLALRSILLMNLPMMRPRVPVPCFMRV